MDHTNQTPLPPCFWLGMISGGTCVRSEDRRRETRVFTHWLPPLASSLTYSPCFCQAATYPWFLFTGSSVKATPAPDRPLMLFFPNVAHTFVNSLNCHARWHAICFLPGLTHTGWQFVECKV